MTLSELQVSMPSFCMFIKPESRQQNVKLFLREPLGCGRRLCRVICRIISANGEMKMAGLKEELTKIFGPESVLDDAKTLESYSKDESFARPLKPRFVVRAQSAAQIERLVHWANRTGIPLVPQSSGPPHFRGDTVPSVPGASCSPLASATSYAGAGPDTIFMGSGDENLLALEWVLPNGDLIRTGSLGAGSGWFCGEGPGPGIHGLIRGNLAARGAMGVFTKCALKLYPWPGPSLMPVEGTIPAYRTLLPDNFKAYTLAFPSWRAWADCAHKILDAGIGYIAHRQFNMFGRDLKFPMIKILSDPEKTLTDLQNLAKDPEIRKVNESMKREFQIVLAGMTPGDTDWQEKALADSPLAHVFRYQHKIREALNPNDLGDAYYVILSRKKP
jgi:hypothetical protein